MKKLIVSLAACAAVMSTAQAQNSGITSPGTTIPNFDVQNVGPVLNELGITWQSGQAEGGQNYIVANVANVVNFMLAPTACRGANNTDCVGLNMVAIFDGSANAQTVHAFNYRYAFASAGIDPDGSAYLSRYEIADYGMPRGNLSTSIQVFAKQILMFSSELETARQTVSLEGFAEDMSSRQLNMQVREQVTGNEIHAQSPNDLHQLGLEQSANIVRQFIADKSAPRNKINNLNAE